MENLLNPEWLDESFLKEVLQSKEDAPKIEVLKWTCKSAVPLGSNYSSLLYSVNVDYKTGTEGTNQSTKVIVKTSPDFAKGALGFLDVFVTMAFNKETLMYKEVLPKMKQLENWEGSPRIFDCSRENTLVLEDLREQGYEMVDRLKLLDLIHCKHAVQSLARLHALSMALNHSHPDLIKAAGISGFYREDSPTKDQEEIMFKMMNSGMLETVKTLPGCERYAQLVASKLESFYSKMVELFKSSDGLKVLCHGDMWINNMLYKYNDKREVVSVKMIDFQQIKYCSFAHDLLYFWFSSPNEEVRENHREEIFELYRGNLNRMLEKLKCEERLSKEEFDRQIKAWAPQSIQIAASLLTLALVEPDDVMDMSKMNLGGDADPGKVPSPEEMAAIAQQAMAAAAAKNFSSKYYRAALPKVLKQMEELGAFL